ncbi:MAG: cell division protein FtsZ, partial [Yaniella sp.]|nr:cell division protein FtsZ [Yaniella sp.]
LLSIQGGTDMGLFEINEAARMVQEVAHPEANIIFGAVISDNLGDEVRVTVIAAGFDDPVNAAQNAGTSQVAAPVAPVASISPVSAPEPNVPEESPEDTTQKSEESQDQNRVEPLPTVVESSNKGNDDLDVPDFLK